MENYHHLNCCICGLIFSFLGLYLAVIDDGDKFANNGAGSLEIPRCVSRITLQILI